MRNEQPCTNASHAHLRRAGIVTVVNGMGSRFNAKFGSISASLRSELWSGAVVARLAAELLDQMDALDPDAAFHRLDHVVDGKAGD